MIHCLRRIIIRATDMILPTDAVNRDGLQMAESEHSLCELLEWDSHHFGLRIGRVRGDQLSTNMIAEIDRWRQTQRIDCLYMLAGIDHLETIRLAENAGFRFTDLRVTL